MLELTSEVQCPVEAKSSKMLKIMISIFSEIVALCVSGGSLVLFGAVFNDFPRSCAKQIFGCQAPAVLLLLAARGGTCLRVQSPVRYHASWLNLLS